MVPMSPETVRTYTPLGIRFWDSVFDRQVRDGLYVVLWPESCPQRTVKAFATGSGVYAFLNIPGLRAIEHPNEDEARLSSIAPQRYVVEVVDTRDRFLPVRFSLWLPITEYRGAYRPGYPGSLPESAAARFYLFSAPARLPAFGIAAIRGQLVEAGTSPFMQAVYALVEVEVDGELLYSYTDRRGCFVVMFPYPPVASAAASPSGVMMTEQTWPVTIRVRYQSKSTAEPDALWEFSRIKAQPNALIHVSTTVTEPELSQTLEYGQTLHLLTEGPDTRSTLWISPSS